MKAVGLVVLLGVASGATEAALRARHARRVLGRLDLVGPRASVVAPAALRRALRSADLALDADLVMRWWLGAVAVVPVVAGALADRTVAVLALLAVGPGPAVELWSMRDRRRRRLDRELPLVLDAIAAGLRGGSSLAQAVDAGGEVPGPAGDAAASLAAAVRVGRSLPDAVDRWQAEVDTTPARLVAAALTLASESGGTAARAVDGVAATLRERIEVADEVRALGAQARLSAVVIAVAPVGFALVAATTDPRTFTFLVGTPVGIACLVAGIGLDLLAYAWMRRIVSTP